MSRSSGGAERVRLWTVLALLLLLVSGCGRRASTRPPVVPGGSSLGALEEGWASWYGPGFHGRMTANGETYDMYAMTAAHKTLPFNTWVRVVNLDNGKSTVVRINDRGPFISGRVIDLSRTAAEQIRMVGPGTARVQLFAAPEPVRIRPAAPPVVTEAPSVPAPERAFTVQVGAFRSKSNASKLQEKLVRHFPDVSVTEVVRGGTSLFRVRVGHFGSLEGANQFCQLLLAEGHVLEAVVAQAGS